MGPIQGIAQRVHISSHFWDVEKTAGAMQRSRLPFASAAARYFFGKDDPSFEVMAGAGV